MSKTEIQYYSLPDAISSIHNPKEAEMLMKDLFTPNEIKSFEERWKLVQLLSTGQYSYKQINEMMGQSTTTIGRVARVLNYDQHGGYKLILERLQEKWQITT